MFSLVDRLLFRPPPFMVDPATVHRVYLYRTSGGVESETGGIYARYIDLAKWSRAFSQMAGVSRKKMIGDFTGRPAAERAAGSVAAALLAVQNGASLVRVHDVKETVDAIKVWMELK